MVKIFLLLAANAIAAMGTPTETEANTTVTSPFCASPKPLPELFRDPPIINLTCTQQYVNVTWIPVECYRPKEVEDRLQNCQASYRCNNGNWINSGCPYFSSTGLNGGWQWDIIEEVSSCIVQVSFVDTRDPFSSLLTQTASCNISSIIVSPSTSVPTLNSPVQSTSTPVANILSSPVQSTSTPVANILSSPVQSISTPAIYTSSSPLPSTPSPPVTPQPGFSTPGVIIAIAAGFVIFIIAGFVGLITIRKLLQNRIPTEKWKISNSDLFPTNIPSVFNDTGSYIALGRDTASTCENINDVKLWIEKSQIWSINEECTSILSENLTDAEMLNYILNQTAQDSGRGSSMPYLAESKLSEVSIGKTMQCYRDDTNQAQNTGEMFDVNSKNNNEKMQQFQCDNACGMYYPIPEHESAQNFTASKTSLDVAKGLMTTPGMADYIDHETVLKKDETFPQSDFSSSKHETTDIPCTLSHQRTENDLNLNSENLMHQQSIDSSKDDTFVNAKPSPKEVVNSCNVEDSGSNISHLDKKNACGVHKDSLPTEQTIMAGAYVQHDVVLEDDITLTFQPHPSLTNKVITDTESTADETFGPYVDSTAAMEQNVISTCEDDASALSFHSQDVSTSNSIMYDMTVTTGELIQQKVAAPPKQ